MEERNNKTSKARKATARFAPIVFLFFVESMESHDLYPEIVLAENNLSVFNLRAFEIKIVGHFRLSNQFFGIHIFSVFHLRSPLKKIEILFPNALYIENIP